MTDVTRILSRIEAGDTSASDELLPLVYGELRRLAASWLSSEQPGQTLQPTALVHEAYLRLIGGTERQRWESSGHFFGAAARAMRRILIENARRRKSQKRGGDLKRIEVTMTEIPTMPGDVDLLALDEALNKLAALDARKAQVVELRFFSGLAMEQAAAALGISVATAQRDWQFARAWLYRELAGEGSTSE